MRFICLLFDKIIYGCCETVVWVSHRLILWLTSVIMSECDVLLFLDQYNKVFIKNVSKRFLWEWMYFQSVLTVFFFFGSYRFTGWYLGCCLGLQCTCGPIQNPVPDSGLLSLLDNCSRYVHFWQSQKFHNSTLRILLQHFWCFYLHISALQVIPVQTSLHFIPPHISPNHHTTLDAF